MKLDWLRKQCLAFPGATENVQWGSDLVFKVAGKMFVVSNTEPGAQYAVSFKCSPEEFGELTARVGIVPAPYLARAKWVAVEAGALTEGELKVLLRKSYELVVAALPKKVRTVLELVK